MAIFTFVFRSFWVLSANVSRYSLGYLWYLRNLPRRFDNLHVLQYSWGDFIARRLIPIGFSGHLCRRNANLLHIAVLDRRHSL